MSDAEFPLAGDGLDGVRVPNFALTVSEGFCAYGHGPLKRVQLHGSETGACMTCGCSWRISGGQVLAAACVPGRHTCGAVT